MRILGPDDHLSHEQIVDIFKRNGNSGLMKLLGLLSLLRTFVRAKACEVWDHTGKKYYDFLAGYGSVNFGHNHPKILAAIERVKDQPNFLQTNCGEEMAKLLWNLAEITPAGLVRIFLCNSGAEAVEAALKLARKTTKRKVLLAIKGGFHGKTMGALSLTFKELYQKFFRPMVAQCECVPFDNIDALEKRLSRRDVAAFIVETVLGEGGVRLHPKGYLKKAQELCIKYGTLLILDEVQTGFGRTGKLFGSEHDDIKPDIICLAKSLGGGLEPIGAIVTTEKAWQGSLGGLNNCLLHTSTFAGASRPCAAANAAIKLCVDEDMAGESAKKGKYLLKRLKKLQAKYPIIREVRGLGLLIGIEFQVSGIYGKMIHDYVAPAVAGLLLNMKQIITAHALNNPLVLRVEPPLVVTYEQMDYFVESLDIVLAEVDTEWKMLLAILKLAIPNILGGCLLTRRARENY